MADQSQVDRLLRSVEEWNRWRKENPKEEIDLSEADLSEAVLRQADLHAASIVEARLRGVHLNGALLHHADLREADLRHAKLRGAKLGRANLRMANLHGAQLLAANLNWTNLYGADLAGAQLTRAKLIRANLEVADLSGADLREAQLMGVLLRRTKLAATRFARCQFGMTFFCEVDLRSALDLETAEHKFASTIGIDTLYRSGGQIPDVFLRGAGVPEHLIELQQSLTAPGVIEFYSCFISYSHQDKSFAQRLHDSLQGQGIRCWLDEKDMLPGERILDAVSDAIRLHDRLLICCSDASLKSWWVKDEIRKAQERERDEGRDILIPLNLDGYLLDDWEDGLASDLRSRRAADFTGWEKDNDKFEEQFDRVVTALRLQREEASAERT